MAASMHARHVSQLLAIGDDGTVISPLLRAAPLQKQTPFTNSLKRNPV